MKPKAASKGPATRGRIVDQAIARASVEGVGALTIGGLAGALGMSKSGLFAHFGSKEALQRAVLEETFRRFAADVVAPALAMSPGKSQLRALFANWIAWSQDAARPGGCPVAGAVFDFDGQPGEIRSLVGDGMRRLRQALVTALEAAKAVDLSPAADSQALAREIIGLYLAQHVDRWLLDEPSAGEDAMAAFDRLLDRASRV